MDFYQETSSHTVLVEQRGPGCGGGDGARGGTTGGFSSSLSSSSSSSTFSSRSGKSLSSSSVMVADGDDVTSCFVSRDGSTSTTTHLRSIVTCYTLS